MMMMRRRRKITKVIQYDLTVACVAGDSPLLRTLIFSPFSPLLIPAMQANLTVTHQLIILENNIQW